MPPKPKTKASSSIAKPVRAKGAKKHHCSRCGRSTNTIRCLEKGHLAVCEEVNCGEGTGRYYDTLHGCSMHPYAEGFNVKHSKNKLPTEVDQQPRTSIGSHDTGDLDGFTSATNHTALAKLQNIVKDANPRKLSKAIQRFKLEFPSKASFFTDEDEDSNPQSSGKVLMRSGKSRTNMIEKMRSKQTNDEPADARPRRVNDEIKYLAKKATKTLREAMAKGEK